MKRLLAWIFGVPAAVVLLGFAVANRSPATISFDPLSSSEPWLALDLPLWVVLYAGILVGLIAGWIAAWTNQSHWRREARRSRAELRSLDTARHSSARNQAGAHDTQRPSAESELPLLPH